MKYLSVLLAYEKYLPVLTPSEVDGLLASHPSMAQLQDWSQRLNNHRAKTGRHYSILLHPEALRIIEKYKGEKKLLRFSEHFKNVDVATVMINKKLAKVRPGLTTYYARHTWASIAFNIGIQKDVVSLALGHSFGVRVTDTYINTDLSRVDEANRMVIYYVIYDKK